MKVEYDITGDIIGPREPSADEIRKKLEHEQLARSYRRVFDGPDGKIILKDLLNECHIFQNTFRRDTKVQDFLEGKRAIGLYLISCCGKDDLASLKELEDGKTD